MTRTIIAAVAIVAFAGGLSVSSAATKHHAKPHADAHAEVTPAPKAGEIPGVNPMTNSPATPPAANKQPYVAMPGVNPM